MTFSHLATFKIQNFWPISLKHHSWEQGFTAVHYGRGTYLYSGQPRRVQKTVNENFRSHPERAGMSSLKVRGKKSEAVNKMAAGRSCHQYDTPLSTSDTTGKYTNIVGPPFGRSRPVICTSFCSRQCHFQFAVVTISSSCRQDGGKNWQTLSDLGAKI